jgi:hypothetical protein
MHIQIDESSRHRHPHWQWFLLMITIPLSLTLSTWGYLIYQLTHEGQTHFWSALYHSFQLFILHMPHLEGDINLPLELGRWFAAGSVGFATVLALHRLFTRELQWLGLVWRRGHVVVCGLGEVGTRMALEYRKNGFNVVAVEEDVASRNIDTAEAHGVTVIVGDARDAAVLREARAHKATQILAVCTEDDTNVAIVVAAGLLCSNKKAPKRKTACFLLAADPALRIELNALPLYPELKDRFHLQAGWIDMPDLMARRVFHDHPMDFSGIRESSRHRVHVMIIGSGHMAEAIAVKALQLGHFANGSRLKLTVLAPDAETFLQNLMSRHLHGEPWYDGKAVNMAFENRDLWKTLSKEWASDDLLTVFFCTEPREIPVERQDWINLSAALRAGRHIEPASKESSAPAEIQILAYLRERSGFGALLKASPLHWNGRPLIHVFGLKDESYSIETLLREEQDIIARELHDDFHKRHGEEPWAELEEDLRDSNRQAADHIPIKLRAFGYRIVPIADWPHHGDKRITSFDTEIPILAEMEHNRWCAERWLAGWQFGNPVDQKEKVEKKINRNLVPWEDLDKTEKEKDPEQIRAIPRALEKAGKAIIQSKQPPTFL